MALSLGELLNIVVLLITAASVLYAAKQAKAALGALRASRESNVANMILHFTARYSDQFLKEDGQLEKKIESETFQNHFWAEYTVEFYFFDHGVIPKDIYTIWMVTLGRLYSGTNGRIFCESHRRFLREFCKNSRTEEFFSELAQRCSSSTDTRDAAIAAHVREWKCQKKWSDVHDSA